MKKITFYFFAVLAVLMFFAGTANAQTILEATGNSFVKGGVASDSNYYSDPSYLLRVRGSSGDDNKRKTYIKFDLKNVTGTFSKAELRITINRVVAISGGLINRADIFTVANDNWDEQTITWNNCPPRVKYLYTQEFVTKTSTMADTVYSLDLTDYVKSEYAGDKVVSICMVDTLNNGTDVRFWSNRSLLATGPQLVLTTGPLATVNVTAPAGGETWGVGTTQKITWTSANINNVKIDYSTNNGQSWIAVIASTPASAKSFNWAIPASNSSVQCKVRISDADNPSTSSLSGVFSIMNNSTSTISITSPTAGEKLIAGSTKNIAWTSKDVANVKIEYSTDNGTSYKTIASSVSAATLSYPWIVPAVVSAQCKIKISDVVNQTVSGVTAAFSIVSSNQNSATLTGNVYVKAGVSADSNYVSDNVLRVRGSATVDNQRKTYIKFDMKSFSGSVDKAELKVTAYQVLANASGPNRMDIFTVSSDTWNESTITWNNAPFKLNYLATQEFATKTTTQPDTTYSIDVTSYVKSEYAGDKIVSFCLMDTTNNNTDIRLGSTRGFTQAPQLVLYTITGVNNYKNILPTEFSVSQNYPNPFNPSTKISYYIPFAGKVKVSVYDALGNCVSELTNDIMTAGQHEHIWNAAPFASGVYFCKVQFGSLSKLTKMILMK